MLMPWVVRYVVAPPSPEGQNNQTVVSTSAATALVLTTLGTPFMGRAPFRELAGRPRAAPPAPNLLLGDDREADRVEVLEEEGSRQRAGDGLQTTVDHTGVGRGHRGGQLGEAHHGVRAGDVVARREDDALQLADVRGGVVRDVGDGRT